MPIVEPVALELPLASYRLSLGGNSGGFMKSSAELGIP